MKLTPWYPPEVKPVREGWYARKLLSDPDSIQYMNFWNGTRWYYNNDTYANAEAHFVGRPCGDIIVWHWRGLAEEPR